MVARPEPALVAEGTMDVGYQHRSPADPARAGGDFVCVDHGSNGTLTVALVDLAAKGISALRQSAVARSAFQKALHGGTGPAGIAQAMNDALLAHARTYRTWLTFGTAFVARFTIDGRLTYVAAGTEPGLLFRGARRHEHLHVTGSMIGLEGDWTSDEARTAFVPGEALIAYSDGIPECRSPLAPDTFLGTSGVVSIVRRHAARGRVPTCHTIMQEVEAWNRGWFLDDATLLVMRHESARGLCGTPASHLTRTTM